jgi:hypothetical protein
MSPEGRNGLRPGSDNKGDNMTNKGFCIIKAERAEARGRKKEAVRWYTEAADACMREARECRLMAKMIDALIMWS